MRAVQLIAFDANKNPFIPPEALQVLRALSSTNLHVVAVAGKYRTGKSYILNRILLGRNQGFNVGHTINACTKGLWMWPQIVSLNSKDCLIVDTEGLGSLEEGESTDLKIFLLALLFSSHLIYNSVGSIDEQAIESLSLVIQLAQVLQRQDKYDSQELVNTFPSFLWLLRDFSLKLENEQGQAITPTQYLQNALKYQQNTRSSQAIERKNQIRKQLRKFFQERDCFALVRPTEEERDLQTLSSLPDSKLRPEFIGLINGLKKKLGDSLKPKRVRGRALSIEGFIELCQYYTKALVDGKLPTISSHWDNLCLGEAHRIFQKFQLAHLKALEAAEGDGSRMDACHKQILIQGSETIDRSFLGKLQKQLFKQKFQRKLESQYSEFMSKLAERKNKHVRALLETIEEQIHSQANPLSKFEAVMLKMAGISESLGKGEGVYCQFYLYLSQFARNMVEELSSRTVDIEQMSERKVLLLEEQIENLRDRLLSQEQSHEAQISLMRKRNTELVATSLNQSSQEASAWQVSKLNSIIASLEKQVFFLKEQVGEGKKEVQRTALKLQRTQLELAEKEKHLFECEKLLAEREVLANIQAVKSRKLVREKEIIKQRYQANLEENVSMRSQIDSLEAQIDRMQSRTFSKTEYAEELEEMRRSLRLCEEERKSLYRLFEDQRVALETLAASPHSLNLSSLRKSLELEKQERRSSESKYQQLLEFLSRCKQLRCSRCLDSFPPSLSKDHFDICSSNTALTFDVSFCEDEEGKVSLQISMVRGSEEWSFRKDLREVECFLTHLGGEDSLALLACMQNSPEEQMEELRISLEMLLNRIDWQSNEILQEFVGLCPVEFV